MSTHTATSHLFHLGEEAAQTQRKKGSRVDARKEVFPALDGMALSLLTLLPNGMREPHWHPNANELSYCLEGEGLMTIFSPNGGHDTLTIEPGTLAMVPMGYLHHIENRGNVPLRLLVCFDQDKPQDLELSSSIASVQGEVMKAVFDLKTPYNLHANQTDLPAFITELNKPDPIQASFASDRFKLNLEGIQPQLKNSGGWVKMSNGFLLPTLEGLALYSLWLECKGVREPHWHPNAHELNYLISGRVRISLLPPGGDLEVYDLEPGDITFLPRGYFHSIYNIGEEPAHLAVFFSHPYPSDIGLSGCVGAYSNAALASLFGVDETYFAAYPKYQSDLLIVGGG